MFPTLYAAANSQPVRPSRDGLIYLRTAGGMGNPLDMRPAPTAPVVGQYGPQTDQALGQAAELGMNVAMPLGLAALGGPAVLSWKNLAGAALQSIFGPMTHPDPNVLMGAMSEEAPPPTVAYRSSGTPQPLTLNDQGILYTTPDEAYSRNWGPHTQQLSISPKNTLDLTNFGHDETVSAERMARFLSKRGVTVSDELMKRFNAAEDAGGEPLQYFGQFGRRELIEALKKAGYDSARINEYVLGGGKSSSTLLFDANLAKPLK